MADEKRKLVKVRLPDSMTHRWLIYVNQVYPDLDPVEHNAQYEGLKQAFFAGGMEMANAFSSLDVTNLQIHEDFLQETFTYLSGRLDMNTVN